MKNHFGLIHLFSTQLRVRTIMYAAFIRARYLMPCVLQQLEETNYKTTQHFQLSIQFLILFSSFLLTDKTFFH